MRTTTVRQFLRGGYRSETEAVTVIANATILGTWTPTPRSGPDPSVETSAVEAPDTPAMTRKDRGVGRVRSGAPEAAAAERSVGPEAGLAHGVPDLRQATAPVQTRPGAPRSSRPVLTPALGDDHGYRYLIVDGPRKGEFIRLAESLRLATNVLQPIEIEGEQCNVRNP